MMDDTQTGLPGTPASFGRRLVAAIIDGIVLGIVSTILGLFLGKSASQGVALLIAIAYYTYFHGATGQTPGNAAMGIRVVDINGGGTIGFGRAFLRWIVSIVSGAVILIGYLWMLWDGKKQTWHDKAARSLPIRTS